MPELQGLKFRPVVDNFMIMIEHDPLILKTTRKVKEIDHAHSFSNLVLIKCCHFENL